MEAVRIASHRPSLPFLSDMAQLPVPELEVYLIEISALIRRKQETDKEVRERILLEKVNQTVLSKKKIERYQTLAEKLEFGAMTDAEHSEFMTLAHREERLRNQRVKYLIELAQLRAVSLPQLMENLGLKSAQNV